MEFSDRLGWILLGMALGYILRVLQDVKKEVDEVDAILTEREKRKLDKKQQRKRDEGGFMKNRIVADVAIGLVFIMCLYATISTGSTNNKLEDAVADIQAGQEVDKQTQLRLARITICTQDYLSKTIEALNERTEFTQAQANANVALQKAQSEFFRLLLTEPPVTDAEAREALELYVAKLQAFVDVAGKNRDKVNSTNYPTADQLDLCLNTPTEDEKANPDATKK